MSKPEFWRVEPNPMCCTCEGDGLMTEKGNSHFLPCVDCGTSLCFGCLFASDQLGKNQEIWCAKHGGLWKSPYDVCGEYAKR